MTFGVDRRIIVDGVVVVFVVVVVDVCSCTSVNVSAKSWMSDSVVRILRRCGGGNAGNV